jgi:uncharacterized protein YbbC (DUF1343 family)
LDKSLTQRRQDAKAFWRRIRTTLIPPLGRIQKLSSRGALQIILCVLPSLREVVFTCLVQNKQKMYRNPCLAFILAAMALSCEGQPKVQPALQTGSQQLHTYLPVLEGKRVGLFINHTAVIGHASLVDLLVSLKVNVTTIYSPEHGFRGKVPDGAKINDEVDPKTGIPVISLYGKSYKATPEQLKNVDVIVFEIQDVGTRFFTYISSMHYMMEACAENKKLMLVLDRPNPNAFVDGPVLKTELSSFIGMHPIPIAHGLTIGELANMINGEGWLKDKKKCDLVVIPMVNYTHGDSVNLPVSPSPNLPNNHAIRLYPYMCLFEGTALSIGRGTDNPFEFVGHPDLKNQPFTFTPVDKPEMSMDPKLEGQKCNGLDLRKEKPERKIALKHLIDMYNQFPDKTKFFIPYFDKLAGTLELKEQIAKGLTEEEIRATWQKDLEEYKKMREKYLLYP